MKSWRKFLLKTSQGRVAHYDTISKLANQRVVLQLLLEDRQSSSLKRSLCRNSENLSALFVAIASGMTIIWERDLGIVHKYLVSPTPRTALVLGKALSAGVRSLSQVLIIYLLALLLGVKMSLNPFSLLGVLLITLLGAACFSTFSLAIACLVKTRERFTGIEPLLTMPLFFASNAIYPISLMPGWLKVVSHVNPLTH